MTTGTVNILWPTLLVLAYMFVTCTLSILTAYRKRAIEEHDLIVNTRKRRREYVMMIEARLREREGSVEIEED